MIRAGKLEISWHSVGKALLRLGIAFGAGFLALSVLYRIPQFNLLARDSPWTPKYIGDSIALMVGLVIIWRISKGKLADYGFKIKGGNLKIKLSLILGLILGLTGILIDRLEMIAGGQISPAYPYPLTWLNILGMMSFQWIFVGFFEEPITRGLVQVPLMNELRGSVRILRWNFHAGSLITAIIFGLGHLGPHMFFGGSWFTLLPHLVFATLYGLGSSYVYQQTRSLVGPILMHNLTDGLIYTFDLLLR